MQKRLGWCLGTVVVAVTLVGAERVFVQAPAPGLELPLRLSAWAVNMSNVATGANAVIDIRITRWTTPAERQGLIGTFFEKKQNGLLRSLERMPDHGRMRVPGWMGADPHNVRLGWTLHYAWHSSLPEGGERIVLATDRYIGFWEARNQPRSTDYPFTFLEIRLDKDGTGEGKMAVATRLHFDKEKNVVELENYSSEPVRLQQIKVEKD